MAISFFARKPFMHPSKRRLMGGSSLIRAEQIAGYLGAKLNPTEGFENDVCIYIKPAMHEDATPAEKFMANSYIDIIDYKEYMEWLRLDPKLSGILASEYSYDYVKKLRLPNNIVLIPQQHCNFERFVRDRKEIKNVGIIGAPRTFQYSTDELRECLKKIGLNLMINDDFQSREDVVNFYKNIDIQLVWDKIFRRLKNPLKIINAASFGIPTVGFPHKGYKEVEGYYIKASTIDQLIEEVEKLKDKNAYQKASENLLQMAEKYHISKVSDLYKKLDAKTNL